MILLSTTGNGPPFLIMVGAMFIVMYFFMIRPQIKKQKREKEYRSKLKKGDKVITIGGLHAKILDVKEYYFIIETHGKNTLKIEKSAVSMDGESTIDRK